MNIALGDLKVGETASIVGFNDDKSTYIKKLLSMGLTRGTKVKVLRVAPLGDPMEIEVRGFQLSLRKKEACNLLVNKESNENEY